MIDVTTQEPERPVFVSDRARRRRGLRAAGLACTTIVALWVTAVVLGALGDRLPGLSIGALKPSATPPPAPVAARPHVAPPRPEPAVLSAPVAAKPIQPAAPVTTAPVSYRPQPSHAAPARPQKRHARVRHHHGATRTQTNGGVRPGRQLSVRQHPVRRPHRRRV